MLDGNCIPRFGAGVKFQFDAVRKAWVVLAPERLFEPDEIAIAILSLIDGKRTIASISDTLARQFSAPGDIVTADVGAMLGELADKGVVRL